MPKSNSEQIIVDNLLTAYYSASPNGKTAKNGMVLFLHGWASSKEVWKESMDYLAARGIGSFALDLPGFGKTDLPNKPWSIADYANFVASFLKKINLSSVSVVGHSFGGRTAIVLSSNYPELVNKLILVDSAGLYTSPRYKKFLAIISKFVKPFFRLRWSQPLRKKIYKRLGAQDYVATPELNQTFVKVIGEDLSGFLPRIKQPTKIIWGKNDFVTPISYAEYFIKHLPQANLTVLENAGHYSFLDKPEEFNSALFNFVV